MIASSTTRPLRLRKRLDVTAHPLQYGLRRYWGIKDPVSLRYYQLRDEEYAIYRMLERPVSLDEIRAKFETDFAPQRLSLHQLQSFLGMLHGEGLVVSDAPGQDKQLYEQHAKNRRRTLFQSLSNPLAIRFRGVDPESFLNWLHPKVKWMLSRWCFAIAVLVAFSALILLGVHFREFLARLPAFDAFFGWRNGLLLVAVLVVTKVLHELGHGIACKHFGGECHELGFMLLVFTPCMYVNVSDAWMLPSKWHRIAISGAGMYVELFLASVCTFLWWFSEPGLLNAVCLNVMFVCSVSTLIFNGNPLLRYDGYYILADLVEVPNLRQQAGAIVKQWLGNFFLGTRLANERQLPERRRLLLALYCVLAVAYRFVVVFAILWVCHQALRPYRLEILAHMLALMTLSGMLIAPLVRTVKFLLDPLRTHHVKWIRFLFRGSTLLVVLGVVSVIPWSHRISVPAIIKPKDARRVYAAVDGVLIKAVPAGATVELHDEIAVLQNRDLDRRVLDLEGRLELKMLEYENLKQRQFSDDSAREQIPAVEEVVKKLTAELSELKADERQLVLKAPVAGTVLPPDSHSKEPPPGSLAEWSGTPLDPRNVGGFLKSGTTVCLVGDPERLEALLVIDQADIEFIRTGQKVRIRLDELPGSILTGTIEEIAEVDLKIAPRELIMHEDLPSRMDREGNPQLVSTSYQARVVLDEHANLLLLGTTGVAKVETAPRSLLSRFVRYVSRTFRIDL